MFIFLPKSVLKQLNAIMFKFLWGGFYKPDGKCHYKVEWEECCKPKIEEGLGLRNILIFFNGIMPLFGLAGSKLFGVE